MSCERCEIQSHNQINGDRVETARSKKLRPARTRAKKMRNIFKAMSFMFVVLLMVRCKEKPVEPSGEVFTLPTVATDLVSEITRTSARCGGSVTSDGGAVVTERGICWSTEQTPTILDCRTTDSAGTGTFVSSISGLSPSTTYFVRAYATNEKGTSYGEEKSFITAEPLVNQTITLNGVLFEMVAVEGGTFNMGAQSSDPDAANYDSDAWEEESPVHQVTLSDYYIGKYEVTQGQWVAVMGSWPNDVPSSEYGAGDDYPAYLVSWNNCQEFIDRLNSLTGKKFRLPTEAEWENAARGGNKSKGFKYSGGNDIDSVGWYEYNSKWHTHPVGMKLPNELGIYDMSGNVDEWCNDWLEPYNAEPQVNPQGPSHGINRVVRDGSWRYDARVCRVSKRGSITPGWYNICMGFRLALDI